MSVVDEIFALYAARGSAAYFGEAVVVRRCDDRGKVAGLATRQLQESRELLRALAARRR